MSKQIFILCAGGGTRLRNVNKYYPKSLVPLGNSNLLKHHIKNCENLNLKNVTILTGHKKRFFNKYPYSKIHNKIWSKTNMFYTLSLCHSQLKLSDSIILYGDIAISQVDLSNLLASTADISLLYDLNWLKYWKKRMRKPQNDLESFKISGNEVIEIGKKNPKLFEIEGQYIGAISLTAKGWTILYENWKMLPDKNRISFTQILNIVIRNKSTKIIGVPLIKPWIEIDSQIDLILAKKIIKYI
jgi:choline kinase